MTTFNLDSKTFTRLADKRRVMQAEREVLETELELSGYDYVDAVELARSMVQVRRWAMCLRVIHLDQKPQAMRHFQEFKAHMTDKQLTRIANKRDQFDYLALWADCEVIARNM